MKIVDVVRSLHHASSLSQQQWLKNLPFLMRIVKYYLPTHSLQFTCVYPKHIYRHDGASTV